MRFTWLLFFIVGVSMAAAEVRMTPERRVARVFRSSAGFRSS